MELKQKEKSMQKQIYLLTHPYFIAGLVVLLVNDHLLKYAYPGFLTGKLSDVSGLFIFPVFFSAFFNKHRRWVYIATGIGFVFWKSSFSQGFIDWWNSLEVLKLARVTDSTDLWALFVLPLSYRFTQTVQSKGPKKNRINPVWISLVAIFAFCATSVPRYEKPEGSIYIGAFYKINLPKNEVIHQIKQLGYNCDYYSYSNNDNPAGYYQSDHITRYWENNHVRDTIVNIKYELTELKPDKTKLRLINVTLKEERTVQDWRELKRLSKEYRLWFEEHVIKKIKQP